MAAATRKVVMVGFADAQVLDITGPLQILAGANERVPGRTVYDIELRAREVGPFRTTSGLSLVADCSFLDASADERIDTLMVSGGDGSRAACRDAALIDFVLGASERARRVVSICTGAFVLAAAGLLDGRRAATHWAAADEFRRQFPKVELDADAIYLRDGKFWTSAGITAGMDLALALVEEDLGREAALAIAQRHVMFMMRPGGQSQFSSTLTAQTQARGRLGRLVDWMNENPRADLSVPRLAERAAMSERTLARSFAAETGDTPARYVERLRVDHARRGLADAEVALEQVADAAGFHSLEQMRRAFQRHLGVTPSAWRERFRSPTHRRDPHDTDHRLADVR